MGYNIPCMARLILQTHKLLVNKRKTVAVAESCTGGLLAKLLTDTPGSSKYFVLGVIAYHNKVKQSLLKVPRALIAKNGAVSEAVALTMARNVRKIAKADFGIGITGIAGPGGGSKAKPAGTVFIAADNGKLRICRRFQFKGSRDKIRTQAALKSLELLAAIV